MSTNIHPAIVGPPLTYREQGQSALKHTPKRWERAHQVICGLCGRPGGTMVKVLDDGTITIYKHVKCEEK